MKFGFLRDESEPVSNRLASPEVEAFARAAVDEAARVAMAVNGIQDRVVETLGSARVPIALRVLADAICGAARSGAIKDVEELAALLQTQAFMLGFAMARGWLPAPAPDGHIPLEEAAAVV